MAKKKKNKIGIVVSDKMQKTVVVVVTRRVRHPVFGKYFTMRNRYKAHDGKSECKMGDKVQIAETRPLSRDKRWVVTQVVEKAGAV